MAASLRTKRGMPTSSPLPARILGEELNVEIITPQALHQACPEDLPADCVQRLLSTHSEAWSAITIPNSQKPLIVYNPEHSPARQNSDLMHELAHLFLGHEPGMTFIDPQSGMALRTHDKNQEEEASWLSGCLLLPRDALWKIKKTGLLEDSACDEYLVSVQMLRFRLNTSGINIQHRRSQS